MRSWRGTGTGASRSDSGVTRVSSWAILSASDESGFPTGIGGAVLSATGAEEQPNAERVSSRVMISPAISGVENPLRRVAGALGVVEELGNGAFKVAHPFVMEFLDCVRDLRTGIPPRSG